MFPFEVKFNKTVKSTVSSNQITDILDNLESLLRDRGVDYLSRESNRLIFRNKLLKFSSGWNLMTPVDAGFIDISEEDDHDIRIVYGITLTRVWIIGMFFPLIIWIMYKGIIVPLIIFGLLGVVNWIIAVLRHRVFFTTLADKMLTKK